MRKPARTLKLRCALLALATVVALSAMASGPGSAGAPSGSSVAATTSEQYPVRGVYDRDFSATGFDHEAAVGFNFIDSGPYKEDMDQLAGRGLKGFVWLGGYSNATCRFNESNDWVRSHISAIAGNPGVGAYYIADEPDAIACPNAPSQIKVRSDLVKSIDPGPPTFIVDYKVDQFRLWAGKTDILGLDHYPCSILNGCDYSKIDEEAAEADRLGIRYWGVIQAHGDAWYKVPTPEELSQEFAHWRATHMQGYLVFAWHWPSWNPALWLANHPELQDVLKQQNGTPVSQRSEVRGVYDRDFSATGFDDEARIGFNFIDSGPYKEDMDQLAARGLKGFVWLGGYSNATCSFNQSDDWIRSHVAAIAGNPGVGAYFIDDGPNAATCPNAPNQIKARSDLVKSIDPGPPTFIATSAVDRLNLYAGTVDIIGLDRYPCSIKNGCDYSMIDSQAAEADRLGIRYWGIIQAHGDDWYKVPTAEELHQEFVHWRATHMEGYLVFAWHWPAWNASLWLANHIDLQAQLALENAR